MLINDGIETFSGLSYLHSFTFRELAHLMFPHKYPHIIDRFFVQKLIGHNF
jgi:hypothetical protein